MRLRIRHQTTYTYDRPIGGAAQIVRLFPRAHAGLDILNWKVTIGPQVLKPSFDGLGNGYALAVTRKQTSETIILVQGEVITHDTAGVLEGVPDPLPATYYLRSTALTEPDDALAALAREAKTETSPARALMRLVNGRVTFQPGATTTGVTAAEAYARRAGVCQDHSHIMLAAARLIDMPARYVSGYLHTGKTDEPASHAWVEVFDGEHWIGLDPANGVIVDEKYVRVAAGLDYEAIAPVRGVRVGGAQERLSVRVDVQTLAEQ